jgi:hypothetical protein
MYLLKPQCPRCHYFNYYQLPHATPPPGFSFNPYQVPDCPIPYYLICGNCRYQFNILLVPPAPAMPSLLPQVRRAHSPEISFPRLCPIPNCLQHLATLPAFREHLKTFHGLTHHEVNRIIFQLH